MVIDAGKGIERKHTSCFGSVSPSTGVRDFTFMNKLDRPSLEPHTLRR